MHCMITFIIITLSIRICSFIIDFSAYRWVILILAMIGKLGITSAFGVVYLYSCELFPTVLRNSAMGMFSTCGRIGAVLAPYIADLVNIFLFIYSLHWSCKYIRLMCVFSGSCVRVVCNNGIPNSQKPAGNP